MPFVFIDILYHVPWNAHIVKLSSMSKDFQLNFTHCCCTHTRTYFILIIAQETAFGLTPRKHQLITVQSLDVNCPGTFQYHIHIASRSLYRRITFLSLCFSTWWSLQSHVRRVCEAQHWHSINYTETLLPEIKGWGDCVKKVILKINLYHYCLDMTPLTSVLYLPSFRLVVH